MLTDPFLSTLKKKYMNSIEEYNGKHSFETKNWEFSNKAGSIEVNASRGKTFGKACVSTISATVTIPGRDYQSHIQWLGIQTFPLNPAVPMFMGVFENVAERGLQHFPCFFDIYPVVPFEGDKIFFKTAISEVAQKHGIPYNDLREGYLKMFQIKETGIGIGYGIGLALGPEEENREYFEEAASSIYRSYFQVVDKRKATAPSADSMKKLFVFRSSWVRFTFLENRFFQGGIQLGVPPESFMLHMLPPVVTF